MTTQNFILSTFRKFEFLFFNKKLLNSISLFDEENEIIDNVIYLKFENEEYRGVFMNGSNPIFSEYKMEDFDLFNLYENYETLKSKVNKNLDIKIDSIDLFFNSDYNELVGFYFYDETEGNSFSGIFMGDELKCFDKISIKLYEDHVSKNLLHVTNKTRYRITRMDNTWVLV